MTDHNEAQRQAWIATATATVPKAKCLERDAAGRNTFKYVPADRTDIRATFRRARQEQKC